MAASALRDNTGCSPHLRILTCKVPLPCRATHSQGPGRGHLQRATILSWLGSPPGAPAQPRLLSPGFSPPSASTLVSLTLEIISRVFSDCANLDHMFTAKPMAMAGGVDLSPPLELE